MKYHIFLKLVYVLNLLIENLAGIFSLDVERISETMFSE